MQLYKLIEILTAIQDRVGLEPTVYMNRNGDEPVVKITGVEYNENAPKGEVIISGTRVVRARLR